MDGVGTRKRYEYSHSRAQVYSRQGVNRRFIQGLSTTPSGDRRDAVGDVCTRGIGAARGRAR